MKGSHYLSALFLLVPTLVLGRTTETAMYRPVGCMACHQGNGVEPMQLTPTKPSKKKARHVTQKTHTD